MINPSLALDLDPVLVCRTAKSFSLFVAVEEHLALILDELAPVVAFPESAERWLFRVCVVLANEGLQVLSRLRAVVERHLREEVMNDVEVRNIMEEEAALPSEERPVDGGSGTTLEVPFLATVVGESRIGVMEVGDHNEPVGDKEPGEAIILDNISSAVESRRVGNTPDHECNTDVGHDDCIALGLGEED